jgi:hypothetical protein
MEMMYAAQQEVIVALTEVGEVDLAGRLERCATARHERRGGDGWPYSTLSRLARRTAADVGLMGLIIMITR